MLYNLLEKILTVLLSALTSIQDSECRIFLALGVAQPRRVSWSPSLY
jgi:hypothetical protein